MRMKKTIMIGTPSAAVLIILLLTLTQCNTSSVSAPAVSNTAFPNPEAVTIQGYTGSAEVPYLTPDGNYIVFDSRTDPGSADVKIYYAKKINDITFQFMGEVGDVNVPGTINFEMTIDDYNNFYFTRIKVPPRPTGQPSIYRGLWNNGTVTNIAPLPGLDQAVGIINQDPTISHDGKLLIFNAWDYIHKCLTYKLAVKNADGSFTALDNTDSRLTQHKQAFKDAFVSSYLYRCANFPHPQMTDPILMGPVSLSHSGLKLVFTMIHPAPNGRPVEKYYIATRSSLLQPFGQPQLLVANGRVVEGGSFSPDDRLLYFHLANGDGTFSPYVMTTDPK